ncbi:MAG: hypothetical protein AAB405_02610 [Patescibacteria group bacterium]
MVQYRVYQGMEFIFYPIFSIATFIFAVLAIFLAKKAMSRGLTYSAMASTVWTLIIIAVARLWRTIYELLEIKKLLGIDVGLIEYALYAIAYGLFIWLAIKIIKVKIPAVNNH